MDDRLTELLRDHDPAVRALAARAFELVVAHVPGAVVTVDKENAGVGTGPGYKRLVYVVTPRRDHVTLGFWRGTELPDPDGLLEGSGKLHRFVRIRSEADLDAPALQELVRAAAERAQP